MLQNSLAIAFLALVALVPLIAAVAEFRRGHFTPAQKCLLWIAVLLTRLLWRSGRPPSLPADLQGAVIVSNHRSSVDPFFVQVCCDRPIRWLVAREYCEHPAFRWFLSTCNVIPVNRGGIDTAATKAAIRCVREGGLVGMFPEGRINMSDNFMLPVRPGAAVVATKASVPMVPCYIEGSPYHRVPWSPFFMSARVRVRFGEQICPSAGPSEDRRQEKVTAEVIRRIAELAGRGNFEPKMAGRRWKPTAAELTDTGQAGPSRPRP